MKHAIIGKTFEGIVLPQGNAERKLRKFRIIDKVRPKPEGSLGYPNYDMYMICDTTTHLVDMIHLIDLTYCKMIL